MISYRGFIIRLVLITAVLLGIPGLLLIPTCSQAATASWNSYPTPDGHTIRLYCDDELQAETPAENDSLTFGESFAPGSQWTCHATAFRVADSKESEPSEAVPFAVPFPELESPTNLIISPD